MATSVLLNNMMTVNVDSDEAKDEMRRRSITAILCIVFYEMFMEVCFDKNSLDLH